ncbi:MAG: hypothetical protein HZA00_13565, partial [Nitrospinae bacterium]|nr:hypothetical protein [Nitrospinota bacterium]
MKKYIYLFAIIILFLFPAPSLTLNTDTYTMMRGITSLFSVQSAEAYTYQDVENAYNNAKTQYPNDYIWKEEFEQDGKKGYKIWRRPNATILYKYVAYADSLSQSGGC